MGDGSKLSDSQFTYHYISNWKKLQEVYEELTKPIKQAETKWIFRADKRHKQNGYKNLDTSKNIPIEESNYFQTSFEEAYDRFKPQEVEKDKRYTRRALEMALLCEFQRKAHQHLTYLPDPKNIIEWLTLVQHYEGPTRLLDWTYSFYVALFFAVARLGCGKEYAEVWAINSAWIEKKEKKILRNKKLKELCDLRKKDPINYMDEYHNALLKHFFEYPKSLVLVLNSFRLNDRLITQQGTFLVQGDIDKSFDDNLKGMGSNSELKKYLHRIVIDVNPEERNKILKELDKMNINSAALFPGLQGFAESLATQLANPGKFGIGKMSK